jgi:hypothetical protein
MMRFLELFQRDIEEAVTFSRITIYIIVCVNLHLHGSSAGTIILHLLVYVRQADPLQC